MSHNCWSHLMYFTEGRHHSVMWPNVNELRWPDLLNTTCFLIFIRIYHLRNGNIILTKRKSVFYKDFSYSSHFWCPLFLSLYTELQWESKLCFFSVTYFSSHLHSSTALIICHFNLLCNSSIFTLNYVPPFILLYFFLSPYTLTMVICLEIPDKQIF